MNGDLQGLFSIKEQNILTLSNFPIIFFQTTGKVSSIAKVQKPSTEVYIT